MLRPLTQHERQAINDLPWDQLIPLVFEGFQHYRNEDWKALGCTLGKALDLIFSPGNMSNPQNWQTIIQLLLEFLPLLLEIIGRQQMSRLRG